MQTLIQNNNQYLKQITSVPIYGIPKTVLMTEILIDDAEEEKYQVCMTVLDYILHAEWCYGFKPTNSEGKYLLITSTTQVFEAHEWLDKILNPYLLNTFSNMGLSLP